MPSACAKTVQNWCTSIGKKCVRLSTQIEQLITTGHIVRVKALLLPQLSHQAPTWFSTLKYVKLPLLNHDLYPLSTAPTIITTKEIH